MEQYSLMARRFEKMDARINKYRRFYRKNRNKLLEGPSHSDNRNRAETPSQTNNIKKYEYFVEKIKYSFTYIFI